MTEQEARQEAWAKAEDRWRLDGSDPNTIFALRGEFVAGATWERSRLSPRVVEAAPSEALIADLEEHCQYHYGGSDPELFEKIDALRVSQPVQVTPEALAAKLYSIEYQVDPDSATPDDVDERLGAADDLIAWFAEHAPPQPVQVEVTTAAELDALNLDAVVVDRAGVPRTKRAGNSHMPGGWTHGGNSPLTSTELADGNPMTVVYAGRDLLSHPAALGVPVSTESEGKK